MRSAARALAAAALLASACGQLETRVGAERLEFELAGRIAVRVRDEASTGQLSWRHRGAGDELLITSPLGQGVARIVREGEAVTLTTAEPREYRSRDAESLAEQVLGFRLPLAGLADWVRARPHAAGPAAAAQYDLEGRLATLEQAGWRIEYLGYQSAAPGALPTRLRLTYPGLELRLSISDWK